MRARHRLAVVALAAAATGAQAQTAAAPPAQAASAPAAPAAPAVPPVPAVPAVQPVVGLSVVGTDNALLAPDGARRSDAIGDLRLDLRVRSRGARVTLEGDLGADLIGYARHTAPDRVLPRGRLELTAVVAERALFLDGSLEASRTRADAFAPALGEASTANTVSTVSLRASPYFQRDLSPTVSALARSDTIVTRSHSETATIPSPEGSTIQREVVRLERRPVPVGLALEATREQTTFQGQSQSALTETGARATVTVGLDRELLLGAVGGRDRTTYSGQSFDDTVYGGLAQWQPSVRTVFDADVEHRFFGNAWRVHVRDRLPLALLDFSYRRAAAAAPASISLPTPDATDPASLVDALLSSRVPSAGARAAAVDEITGTRGLPGDLAQPINIFSAVPQLVESARLELVADGARSTLLGSLFHVKAQALPGQVEPPGTFDSRQWGGSLGWYHRLAPEVSAGAEGTYSRIEGLGARAGDSSRQFVTTLSLTRRLNPQASLSCGLRRLDAHVELVTTDTAYHVTENQVFAGLRVQY